MLELMPLWAFAEVLWSCALKFGNGLRSEAHYPDAGAGQSLVISRRRCPLQATLRERLAARDRFSLAEVRRWIADESDLELWAAVYDVLGPGRKLIKPEPDMDETCGFMTRYLLRCIHENVQNDDGDVPTGYEAPKDLANSLKQWATKLPETRPVLSDAASKITNAYRTGDDAERDRLLNGTLEHALEAAAIRSYFEQWKNDPVLGEPWHLAMEWAVAHGDATAR